VPEKKEFIKPVAASSVRTRVSNEEWEMRLRSRRRLSVAALFNVDRLIYTTLGRVPRTRDSADHPLWADVRGDHGSTLVKIDKDGNIIDDPTGLGINYAGFRDHGAARGAAGDQLRDSHPPPAPRRGVGAEKCGLLAAEPAFVAGLRECSPTTTTRALRSIWMSARVLPATSRARAPRP